MLYPSVLYIIVYECSTQASVLLMLNYILYANGFENSKFLDYYEYEITTEKRKIYITVIKLRNGRKLRNNVPISVMIFHKNFIRRRELIHLV